jgi:hypothetical protein
MRLRLAIFVAHEHYILQLAPFRRNRKRLSEIEGSVSATTELADNSDSPDRYKDERSLLAESVQPSPNAAWKECSALRHWLGGLTLNR